MKLLRVLLVVMEVVFLALLLLPLFIESRPLARAIGAYHDDPSPGNKIELERQQGIVGHERFRVKGVILVLLLVNSAGLIYLYRPIPMGGHGSPSF